MLLGPEGNLYGTASVGGFYGYGIVFDVHQSGQEAVLHNFYGVTDGAGADGSLISDGAGHLYGTTSAGGVYGYGTVFKLNKAGNETVLYSFTGGADGAYPEGGLVMDSKANLYGTTSQGGQYSYGTVFKLNPKGGETVLYSFTGGTDGANPVSSLVKDPEGNLYGTTVNGGPSSANCLWQGLSLCGVAFELTPAGNLKILHGFTGMPDGKLPFGGLLFQSGALYGTTSQGGAYSSVTYPEGCGTVFKVVP